MELEETNLEANGPGNAARGGFLEKMNLPQILAGQAGVTISKLVAGMADIPVAWLEGKSRTIRDNTEAKSKVLMSVVGRAAEEASNDPALVDRAKESFLGDLARKQQNREAVARIAVEQLAADLQPASSEIVSDDWLDYFSSYAEKANSERMRELWGRILVGEVRTPGNFSLTTMRFMAELDASTAQCVEKYFTKTFGGASIFHHNSFRTSPQLTDVTLLENLGLLNGVGGTRSRTLKIEENGYLFLQFQKHAVVISGKPGLEIKLNCLLLTQLGREVLSILSLVDDLEEGRTIASEMPKRELDRISWFATRAIEGRIEAIYPETVLWEKPIVEEPTSEPTS